MGQLTPIDGPCPCGTGQPYRACCGPRHDGSQPAETAEALMRSRYSAFAVGDGAYLVATQAKPGDAEALGSWGKSVLWLGLEITARQAGGLADDEGIVAFVARYLEGGAECRLVERSRFDRAQGRWRYRDGVGQSTRRALGRNDRCPCGSGKKLKSCHG